MSEPRSSTTPDIRIRPFAEDDADEVAGLSLRAWEPVFRSFRTVLGDAIYFRLYPDWREIQDAAVRRTCLDHEIKTFVVERDGVVAGFAALATQQGPPMGIVDMIAVDLPYQRQGLGRRLMRFAIEHFAANGLNLVNVGTGGDPGHAPARRLYENVGFEPLPLVNYYRAIDPA